MTLEQTITNNPVVFTIIALILLNWISILLLKGVVKLFRFIFRRNADNTALVRDFKPLLHQKPLEPRFQIQQIKPKAPPTRKVDGEVYMDLTQ